MSGIISAVGPRGIFLDRDRPGRWDECNGLSHTHVPSAGRDRPMSNTPDQAPASRPEEGGPETWPRRPPAPPPGRPTLATRGPPGPTGELASRFVPGYQIPAEVGRGGWAAVSRPGRRGWTA